MQGTGKWFEGATAPFVNHLIWLFTGSLYHRYLCHHYHHHYPHHYPHHTIIYPHHFPHHNLITIPSSLSSSLPSSFPSSLPSSQPPLHSLKVKTASVFTTTYLQGMFSQSRGFHCNFILNYIFVLPSWWSLDFPHWCKRNLGGTYTT